MRKFAFPVLMAVLVSPLSAQHWVDLLMDGESNVFEVKDAFDAQWQGRGYERGNGWKQFNRWYWFMEQRTWPSGERPDPAIYLQAMAEVKAMREQKSSRDVSDWSPLGPVAWYSESYNPGNGRVNAISVDPADPAKIYVGTPSSGVWRSLDHGGIWEPLFTDLPSMGVSGIAIHPTSPDTIFIATGDGNGADTYSAGVLKTTDGGATWQPTGLDWNISASRTTRALRMDPHDPNRMYCAASNGLFRTIDGGENWSNQVTGSFRDVEFMPGDTSVVYACSNRFFRSVNGGTNFAYSSISGLPSPDNVVRMAIAVTPADPQMVYALCAREDNNGFLGLYRSTDGGQSFYLRSNSPNIFTYDEEGAGEGGQAWYDMALAVDPNDADVVYAGGINVWKSIDGGLTWEIISHWIWPSEFGYTHADIHSLDIYNGKLYCGSDGGIYVSEYGTADWSDLSAGLDITQFYRLGGSELFPDLVLAGAQDNGSNRYFDMEWTHIHGGDGMEAAVDLLDPSILYCSYQKGGIMRSDDLGLSWNYIADDIYEEGAWVTPFAIDQEYPMRLMAGYNNIWITEDRGEYWYPATWWDDEEKVRCVAFAPSNGNVAYAARNDLVQRTTNGGTVWTDIKPGLPNLSPTSIAVDQNDPYHVWITFSGSTSGQKVYESLDGGATWHNRSMGLPNVPVNSIVIQPNSPNTVYVGTDMGVFRRDDVDVQWEIFGAGLPNVIVNEVEVNMALGKLRAATYGRGIWEADLYFSPYTSIKEETSVPGRGPLVIPYAEQGLFAIRTDERSGNITHVQVLDALGRDAGLNPGKSDPYLLDLRARPGGTYIVVIQSDKGRWIRRVIR